MDRYVHKDGKMLRKGYTTGSCAAAASKAACWMLLTGKTKEKISLQTPKGTELHLEILEISRGEDWVRCAVRKDCGDDPDVTGGSLVFSTVSRKETEGVEIDGGKGVGRVTKRGLDQPVGAAAINRVPRKMIREAVEEVRSLLDAPGGFSVLIEVPEGEKLAKKTFNPRLGIEGGISILGTTGIVEPMSEKALVDTIRVEMKQRRALGEDSLLLTPGNYGSDFIKMGLGMDANRAVQTSNYIGDSLDIAEELGFRKVLLVGHVGKLVKLSGNMMNTHSKYGDCRMEILAAQGAALGLSGAPILQILDSAACDEGLRILQDHGLMERTMNRVLEKAMKNVRHRAENLEIEMLIFSKVYGRLAKSSGADSLILELRELWERGEQG